MTHNEKFQHTIAKTEGSFEIFHKNARHTIKAPEYYIQGKIQF